MKLVEFLKADKINNFSFSPGDVACCPDSLIQSKIDEGIVSIHVEKAKPKAKTKVEVKPEVKASKPITKKEKKVDENKTEGGEINVSVSK